MWYAVLPTFTIITAALYLPNMFAYFTNKLFLGQPYRRSIIDNETCYFYLRDAKLGGKSHGYNYKLLVNSPTFGQMFCQEAAKKPNSTHSITEENNKWEVNDTRESLKEIIGPG